MKEFKPSSYLLWNSDVDDFSVPYYYELLDRSWDPRKIALSESRSEWVKIDAKLRFKVMKSLLSYKVLEQEISTKLLPLLLGVVGEEFVTRRAMLSKMISRINGEHSILTSNFIKELAPQTAIMKAMDEIEVDEWAQNNVSMLGALFKNLEGWKNINSDLKVYSGHETYDELNLAIWKACSVVSIVLEAGLSETMGVLLLESKGLEIQSIREAFEELLIDLSVMSSYMSSVAVSRLYLIPNSKKDEAIEWVTVAAKYLYGKTQIEEECINYATVNDYLHYNINKSLWKLGIDPIYDKTHMPKDMELALQVARVKTSKRRFFK